MVQQVSPRVLVIEDDRVLSRLIKEQMTRLGLAATAVATWAEVDAYLAAHEPQLIVADVRLGDGDALERLPDLVKGQPVILLTAYGSVRDAVAAMKAGAYEYLVKPVSPDELALVTRRALDTATLRRDQRFCRQRLEAKEAKADFMVGQSAALARTREAIVMVGPTDVNVLIQGESGSGKELVARAVHEASERAQRHLVPVDCCTLQEKLFESELFGHERGAFTGADRMKRGLIEGAEGGTLFRDEIGEIDAAVQAKLLRVIETGVFRRLGGTKDLQANARIVAATNRDLAAMSEAGGFRADLFYRLSTFVIQVPPLRERREDIAQLVEYLIAHHNFSRRIDKALSAAALRSLHACDWPGNVRELKNVVERAIILSGTSRSIGPEHLAFGGRRGGDTGGVTVSFDHDPTLEELQAAYLRLQLQKQSGRRAKVARVLAVSERNIYRLIRRYGLAES